MFYVYEHIRPDTNAVFYVGKGKQRRAYSQKGRNAYWRRIVDKADGFSVRMVAENMDEELAFLIEVERIDQLRRLGVKVCNMTDGGEGSSGCIPSNETRRKLSEVKRGCVASEETRRKLSEAKKGKAVCAEARRKSAEARRGKALSAETRRKISEANKGQVVSTETRRKISEANKGRVRSDEIRRKMLDAAKNRVYSDETRRKLSEANMGRVPSNAITVQFDGMAFESITALARYTGKDKSTVANRIRRCPQKYGYVVLQSRGWHNGMV